MPTDHLRGRKLETYRDEGTLPYIATASVRPLRTPIAGRYPLQVLGPFGQDEYLSPSIEAGATGYLLKRANRAQMVEAIHEAVDGGAPLDPLVTPGLLYRLRNPSGHEGAKLSSRETQVLELVAAGLSNKEIASQLTVMQSTVKNHMTSILQKLDANDRTHAVTIALRKDWISNPIPIDHKAPRSI